MKIYTKKGDAGTTGLLGGERVPKHDRRVDAYGAVDELNSQLGAALALWEAPRRRDRLAALQEDLLVIGARLAAADPRKAAAKGLIPDLPAGRIDELETWIDELEATLPPLDSFLLPGGTRLAAQLHVARTVCRRAERAISGLLDDQPDLGALVLPYMNRLSDLLFVLARDANREAGQPEPRWRPVRRGGSARGPAAPGASEESGA